MPTLTTGPIDNRIDPFRGQRPSQEVAIRVNNRNAASVSTVRVIGYYLTGLKQTYVLELINIEPGSVVTRTYYANFDGFEFEFVSSGDRNEVQVSVWGMTAAGSLVTAHRLVSAELLDDADAATGATGATGSQGATGVTGATGATGPQADSDLCIMTTSLGNISTVIGPNEGSGNNQAIGGIAFGGDLNTRLLSQVMAFVVQLGAGTGEFQIAVLQATSTSTALVVAVTDVVTQISGGLFTLPLTSSVNIDGGAIYYLAVYNQVNASQLGAVEAGTNNVAVAPPINFRVQNVAGGFTVGDTVSITDVSLFRTPWLAAMR